MKPTHLLAATLLILAVLASIPVATATSISETFDSYTTGAQPCTNGSFAPPCTNAYSTWTVTSGSSQVQTTHAESGKALQMTGSNAGTGSSSSYDFATGATDDLCAGGPISWALAWSAVPAVAPSATTMMLAVTGGSTGTRNQYGLHWISGAIGGNAAIELAYTQNGGSATTSSLTFTNNLQLNTFYHFTMQCPAGSAGGSLSLASAEATAIGNPPVTLTVPNNAGSSFQVASHIGFDGRVFASIYVDNMQFTTTANPNTAGYIFCSSKGLTNFGYQFKEDVDTNGDASIGGGASGDTYIFHSGSSTGLALLGRDLQLAADGTETATTSHALNTTFKIEAATEGASSDFRVTYSFVGTFGRGNGDTTGSFTNALQARFTETGNLWHIETRKIVGSTITSFGATADQDNPNDSHTYQFLIDTRTPTTHIKILDGTGATIIDNSAVFPSTFNNLAIDSQWFTTDSSAVLIDVQTGLTPHVTGGSNSTCIYDLEGNVNPAGGIGTPGSLPCSGSNCATSSSSSSSGAGLLGLDPTNLDPTGSGNAVTGGFFEALLLIFGFAVIGAGIMPGNAPSTMIWGAGLGTALGFIFTVFMGVMPPVITFIFVLVGIMILGFRLRAGKEDTGGG